MGAEVLFYPTAIGSEPHDTSLDTARLWRRAMVGHAVSNVVPIVAANRIGTEHGWRQFAYGRPCVTEKPTCPHLVSYQAGPVMFQR